MRSDVERLSNPDPPLFAPGTIVRGRFNWVRVIYPWKVNRVNPTSRGWRLLENIAVSFDTLPMTAALSCSRGYIIVANLTQVEIKLRSVTNSSTETRLVHRKPVRSNNGNRIGNQCDTIICLGGTFLDRALRK